MSIFLKRSIVKLALCLAIIGVLALPSLATGSSRVFGEPVKHSDERINLMIRQLAEDQQNSQSPIKPHEDVKKYCQDKDIDPSTIQISMEERDKLYEENKARIESNSADIEELIKTKASDSTDSIDFGKKTFVGAAGVAVIFFVLSILSFFIMFIWCILNFCFCKTANKKPNSLCKTICLWLGVVFAVLTVIMSVVWSTAIAAVIKKTPEVKCAGAITYSSLINGWESKASNGSTMVFAGFNNLKSITDSFKQSLASLKNQKAQMDAITAKDLKNKGDQAKTDYNTWAQFNPSDYTYAGVDGSSIVPGLVNVVDKKKEIEKEEVDILANIGKEIHDSVTGLKNFTDGSASQDIENNLNEYSTSVDNLKRDYIDTGYEYINPGKDSDKTDYLSQLHDWGLTALVVQVIVFITTALIYLFILLMTYKCNKCHCLKFISKIILIVQILFLIFVFMFGFISAAASVAINFACFSINKSYTEPNYIPKLADFNDETLTKVLNHCVVRGADGNGLAIADFDPKDILSFSDDGFDLDKAKKDLNKFDLSKDLPPVTDNIMADVNGFSTVPFNYTKLDTPQEKSVYALAKAFNDRDCSKDKIYVRKSEDTSGHPHTEAGQNDKTGLGSDFSIYIDVALKEGITYSTRYNGVTVNTGCQQALNDAISGGQKAKAWPKYATFKTHNDDKLKAKIQPYFGDIKTSANDVDQLVQSLNSSLTQIKAIGNNLGSVSNCLVMQDTTIMLENILCYKMGKDAVNQSALGVAFGVIVFFYSWCMCLGICFSRKYEGEEDDEGRRYHEEDEDVRAGYT